MEKVSPVSEDSRINAIVPVNLGLPGPAIL
jgi:hypothetical protein